MQNFIIVAVAVVLAGFLAFSPHLNRSSRWKATVTPLASIMGSGFLVSAPLLGSTTGNWSVLCMAALLLLAYAVGGAIRFNIRYFEPIEEAEHGAPQIIAFLSRIVLAGAYFISVTYYLQLLAAFAGSAVGISGPTQLRLITTCLLLVIGGVGMWRGLAMLENLEKYAIALNLGMVVSLLVGLAIYNVGLAATGGWELPRIDSGVDFHGIRVLLGLLIVVQGFETSRYLGDEHPSEVRIKTMRWAQLISSVLYLLFLALVTVRFQPGMRAEVTSIVAMARPIALVLPALISVAAIGSQFSAAVADNEGAGGLLEDITHARLPVRYAYLLILLITIALTWETDVNWIIACASRAFALFYTLQCAVALLVAWNLPSLPRRSLHLILFASLALVCLAVFLLGLPAA